eukprot:10664346-Alexandrium_andersonii.AAC.1
MCIRDSIPVWVGASPPSDSRALDTAPRPDGPSKLAFRVDCWFELPHLEPCKSVRLQTPAANRSTTHEHR